MTKEDLEFYQFFMTGIPEDEPEDEPEEGPELPEDDGVEEADEDSVEDIESEEEGGIDPSVVTPDESSDEDDKL